MNGFHLGWQRVLEISHKYFISNAFDVTGRAQTVGPVELLW
jgi:hypothetical protein